MGSYVVFNSCQIHNCKAAQMFGVMDERSGSIGVSVIENGKAQERGTLNDEGRKAISCARVLDEQAAKRAEDSLKRGKQ